MLGPSDLNFRPTQIHQTSSMRAKFQIAAVHAAPVYMDKEATTDKIVWLIEKAAQDSIDFLAFSEAFLPGYPVSDLCSTPSRLRAFSHVANRITEGSILCIYSHRSKSSRL